MTQLIVNIQNLNLNIFAKSKQEGLEDIFNILGIPKPETEENTEEFLDEDEELASLYDYLLEEGEDVELESESIEEKEWDWGENNIDGESVLIQEIKTEGDRKSLGGQKIKGNPGEKLGFRVRDPGGIVHIFPNVSRFLKELKEQGKDIKCTVQEFSDLGKGRGLFNKGKKIKGWSYAGDRYLHINPYED